MQKTVWQVTTDGDGRTSFSTMSLDFVSVADASPGGIFQAAALGSSDVAVVQFEPDFTCEFHHTPAPTWMFFLSGQMQIEVSDGATQILSAGDLIRMEDGDGQGHRSRVVSDEPVVVATAGYSEN